MTITSGSCSFIPQLERFRIPFGGCSFKSQYAQMYTCRLAASRSALIKSAAKKWGAVDSASSSDVPMKSKLCIRLLSDLTINEECVIIGTLFKDMPLQPRILRELAELEFGVPKKPTSDTLAVSGMGVHRLISEDDHVYLEDEVQRIALRFPEEITGTQPSANRLLTGIVAAVRGCELDSAPGFFSVQEVAFLEPSPERPILTSVAAIDDYIKPNQHFLALISGLGFVGSGMAPNEGHALALRLLGDWLRGAFATGDGHSPIVSRLVLLGDSIRKPSIDQNSSALIQQARYLTRNTDVDSVMAMGMFDSWLAELPLGPGMATEEGQSTGLLVDILPGPADCVSQLMPQQPLHAVTLPKAVAKAQAAGRGSLSGVTNPYAFSLGGRKILATSGQGVVDIARFTDYDNVLDCMEASLHWGHLAPTCPDSLFGYPLVDTDPLLLRPSSEASVGSASIDYPDVYAVGNQLSAAWRRASLSSGTVDSSGALLLSVPRFDLTHTFVLLNLDTLQCLPVRFDLSALAMDDGDDLNASAAIIESSIMEE